MLKLIRSILLSVHKASLRFPRITVSIYYTLALCGALAATKVEQLIDLNDLFDKDFTTYTELNLLNNNFPDNNSTYVIISSGTRGQPPNKTALCDISRWTLDVAHEVPDILQIVSSFGARFGSEENGQMKLNKVLNLDCATPENPEKEQIKAGLKKMHETPWRAILASTDSDDIVVSFFLDVSKKGTNPFRKEQKVSFDTNTVGTLMTSLEKNVLSKHSDLKVHWAGVGPFKFHLLNAYEKAGIINVLGMLVMMLFFRWVFGTWKSGFLFLLSYLLALLPVLGGMSAALVPMDTLTSSLPIMLLIAGLEDFVYVSFMRKSSGTNWRKPFRKVLLPGFMTSLTTAFGFGSLVSSDLSLISRFGFWCALAVILEFLTCYSFLPALMKVHPSLRDWVNIRESARINRLAEKLSAMSLPRWVAIGSICLFLIIPFGLHRLKITEQPEDAFPRSHEIHTVIKKMHETRNWHADLSLVFYNSKNREKNEAIIKTLAAHPIINAYENPYEVDDYLTKDMSEVRKNILLEFWHETPLAERLRNKEGELIRAIFYMTVSDMDSIEKFVSHVRTVCQSDCYAGGTIVSYGEFGTKVLRSLIGSLGWSDFLVGLVMVWLCLARGVRNIFAILISSLWGPAVVVLAFIIFNIPVYYVSSVFAAVLVGLAGDNAVQYIFSDRKGDALKGVEELGPASIYLGIGMMALSLVFFVSPFEPVNTLGYLMSTGLMVLLFGDIWILKALLQKPKIK